jgi:putative heme-binding domain-containing protein
MAVASLARLDGADSRRALEEIAARGAPRSLRMAAIAALSRADLATAAAQAARLFSESHERDFDPTLVIRAFLARQGGADALAGVLEEIDLTPALAELGLQALSSAGRSDERLMTVFSDALGIARAGPITTSPITSYSPELVKKIGAEALAKGDARHGEVVFRSRAANCHACHTVGGDGGWAGPDLSAVGTTLPLDRLVEEVLWPRRHVKEGYSLVQVVTQDGEVYQGYEQKGQKRKRDDTLLLRELTSGDVLRIPPARIASRIDAGTAMPSGLAASLPRTDLHDLLRFLSELGTWGAK